MSQQRLQCRTVNDDGLGACVGCGAPLQRKLRSYIPIHDTWEFALVIGMIVVAVLYLLAGRG